MINRKASQEPLYKQVVRNLLADIETGKRPIGTRLPTEQELSKQLGVSRHTVREALRQLRAAGTITSRQGSGSMIANAGQPSRYVHAISDLSELLQYAAETRLSIERTAFVKADAKLASRLNCSPNREWLLLEGLRFGAEPDSPIGWTEVYVHASYGRIRNLVGKRAGPISSWIESEFDERVVEVRQTIRATVIPENLAEILDCQAGSAALEVERVYLTDRDKVIEVAFSIHPADRFAYFVTLRRKPGE
ncbi:MAG: GntR family transcriptional regulator [Pseudomonadota bacterium]